MSEYAASNIFVSLFPFLTEPLNVDNFSAHFFAHSDYKKA